MILKICRAFYNNFLIIVIIIIIFLYMNIFENYIYDIANLTKSTIRHIKSLEDGGLSSYIDFCAFFNFMFYPFIISITMDKDDFYSSVKHVLIFILFMLFGYSILVNIVLPKYTLPQMQEFILLDIRTEPNTLASLDSLDVLNRIFKYNYFLSYIITGVITVFHMLLTKLK